MTVSTRRELLGGAAAGAVMVRVADAPAGPVEPRATPEVVLRGRALAVRGRRIVVAHQARRTVSIGTRIVDVGGQPVDVALAPGGRLVAVSTAFWDEPAVALVDAVSGEVVRRIAAGPAPGALAFTPDGRRLVVAGGEQEGALHVIEVARPRVVREIAVGLVPRGLALTPDGSGAWVALQAEDRLRLVDLAAGRVRRALRTATLPDRLALHPDGRRLLITHGGLGAERVTELDVRTRRARRHLAGRLPSAVAWTPGGRRLVALGGASEVVELGRRRRHRVGPAPRDLVVAGRRLYTVSGLTGEVSRRRL